MKKLQSPRLLQFFCTYWPDAGLTLLHGDRQHGFAATEKGNAWYCQFLFRGKRHTFSLGPVSQDDADAKAKQVDCLLLCLKKRYATLPPGMGIVEYVLFDGKPAPAANDDEPVAAKITLSELRDRYRATHEASLEPTTIEGMKIHFKHFADILSPAFPIAELQLADLQRYADVRAKANGTNGRKLSPATIKKEIVRLRTAWNWAVRMKLVAGRFPYDGLVYRKTTEKPPFQTMAEIKRQVRAGGLTEADIKPIAHIANTKPSNQKIDSWPANWNVNGSRRCESFKNWSSSMRGFVSRIPRHYPRINAS